jgi:hypothetical protein
LSLGVVDQNVAIGEIEDARPPMVARAVPAGLGQLPADLERDHGLAGAGRHGEQDAPPALKNRLDAAVDRDLLVVAGLAVGEVIARCEQMLGGGLRQSLAGLEPVPQLLGPGKIDDLSLRAGQVVELDGPLTVGRISELQPERLGVGLGLLQAVAGRTIERFGFDHRDGEVQTIAQEIVGPLARAAPSPTTGHDDPAIGEGDLLA